jgi:hypothetical protein
LKGKRYSDTLVLDASRLDFRNPEVFHHDINSVAGLLKQFFRDLPDPLLTGERYGEFINAARKSLTSPNFPKTPLVQAPDPKKS